MRKPTVRQSAPSALSMCVSVCLYVYIYIFVHIYITFFILYMFVGASPGLVRAETENQREHSLMITAQVLVVVLFYYYYYFFSFRER